MNSLRVLIVCCSVLGVISSKLVTKDADNAVWGSADNKDTSVRPFTIEWTEEQINDLKNRIKNTRYPTPALPGTNFVNGVDPTILKTWLDYWANEYDFNGRAKQLNKYPQYKTVIQGLDIHVMQVKPEEIAKDCKVVPLLLIHGFPGSIIEYYGVLPNLTTCVDGIAFEIIAPSLPGFAFSDAPNKSGFGVSETATVLVKLMARLGYDKFYLQSQDFMQIGATIATLYPENVLGYHTNHAVSLNPLSWSMWLGASRSPSTLVESAMESRMYPMDQIVKGLVKETGVLHLMATKPDTLGIAMSDSPAAMLAFILPVGLWGKDRNYSQMADGGLSTLMNRDEELDNSSWYWFTNCFTSVARIFAETFSEAAYNTGVYTTPTNVPTWTVHAPNDYFCQAPAQLKIKYPNLIKTEVLDEGGHFLAYKSPEVYVKSVRAAIAAFEKYQKNDRKCEL